MNKKKQNLIWLLLFPLLAAFTLWGIISTSRSFSWERFQQYLTSMSPGWLAAAIAAMLSYIVMEGVSLRFICARLGHRPGPGQALTWSATDIFFSALTPSATGGQPAAAVLMLKNKVPGHICTVALLLNLILYTLSILVIGPVFILLYPSLLNRFSTVSLCFIGAGILIQLALSVLFMLLILKPRLVGRAAAWGIRLLSKLHLVSDGKLWLDALEAKMPDYAACSAAVAKDRWLVTGAFACNLLQRLSLLLVPFFVYLGTNGVPAKAPMAIAIQSCVVLGSNAMPLPGAMGVADYLFLDGYSNLVSDTVCMELLSRGISFYGCFLLCGLVVLVGRIVSGVQKRRNKL